MPKKAKTKKRRKRSVFGPWRITPPPHQAAADHIELGRLQERAIERGDRLEKIAEILEVADQQSNNDDGSIDLDPKQAKQIYRLAKGSK